VGEFGERWEPALWVTLWAALGAGHSLSIAQREHDTHANAYCLEAMARLAVVEDDPGQALRLYGEAKAIRRDIGIARSAFDDSWLGTWLGGVLQSEGESA